MRNEVGGRLMPRAKPQVSRFRQVAELTAGNDKLPFEQPHGARQRRCCIAATANRPQQNPRNSFKDVALLRHRRI